jgi:hypothetical protein
LTDTTKVEVAADLELGNTDWELVAEVSPRAWRFQAKPATKLRLGEFLKALSAEIDAESFPDIPLPSATFTYCSPATLLIRFDTKFTFSREAPVKELNLAFAFAKLGGETAGSRYVAGIRSTTRIGLETIVGKEPNIIGKLVGDIGISRIGVFYASDDINDKVDKLALFDGEDAGPQGFAKGLSFSARLGTQESYTDIALPPPPPPQPAETGGGGDATPASRAAQAGPADVEDKRLRKWFEVRKTFGPLELRRIGGEWNEGKLGLLLDASVELLGLKVGLAGLRVSVAPAKLANLTVQDLEVGLDGLEIGFQGGPISISGAFLKSPDGAYSGMALIRAATFTITAIGSYTTTERGDPSLFIFGAFVGIIGGPPAFVVQGIAAGFGYNRGLTVPQVEDVRNFPLVSMVMSPPPGGSTNMLEQLGGNHFPTVQGQYWLAAGIKFTSFKLIDAFALLTVQFGARFELALLGVATMQQPPKVDGVGTPLRPFLYVELALSVRFAPDDGLLAARAVLTTNSYLFDTRCKLTGGFAFCIWFKPTNPAFADHAGDFVLTFGGYHPRFKLPAHYPQVPRIGFNWQLPDQGVTIKGECYFALTPSCLMAGCRLTAIYRSGDFAAWFEAYADFLMAWAPFHYEADIGIFIGASFTLRVGEIASTISFQIGASLSIWGPEFAGEAYIDLGIVAFTVQIGAANVPRTPPPLTWNEFSGRFIPQIDNRPAPLNITITGGLLREDKDKGLFFVNPSELGLTVDAYIPVTKLLIGTEPLAPGNQPLETKFGIRPLAEEAIDSELVVWFRKDGEGAAIPMQSRAVTKGLPEALWSQLPAPSPRGDQLIEAKVIANALSGVRLFAPVRRLPKEAKAARQVLSVQKKTTSSPGLDPVHAPPDDRETARERFGKLLIDNSEVRKEAVAALKTLGFDLSPEAIDLEQTARCVSQSDVLSAPPLFVALGQLPPLRQEQ